METNNWISVDTKTTETWANVVKRAMYQRFRETCASLVIKEIVIDWLNTKIRPKIQEKTCQEWLESKSSHNPAVYSWTDTDSESSDDEYQEFDDNAELINVVDDWFTRGSPTDCMMHDYVFLLNIQRTLMLKGIYGYESVDDSYH